MTPKAPMQHPPAPLRGILTLTLSMLAGALALVLFGPTAMITLGPLAFIAVMCFRDIRADRAASRQRYEATTRR